jgi:hypothetical protein
MGEEWDNIRYAYGSKVAVSYEVVAAEIDQNVLATLDVDAMDGCRVWLYMYMQTPDSNPPIVEVTPSFGGRRRLQQGDDKVAVGANIHNGDMVIILGKQEDTTAGVGTQEGRYTKGRPLPTVNPIRRIVPSSIPLAKLRRALTASTWQQTFSKIRASAYPRSRVTNHRGLGDSQSS